MANVVRLYCAHCNPEAFLPTDRRETGAGVVDSLPGTHEQRTGLDRRRVQDRRVSDSLAPGMADRRQPAVRGRRQGDGYAWFEGCIEKAIRSNWRVVMADAVPDADTPATVLCPKCRNKIR